MADQTLTDATYSPAVLIIDDDASVRAYYKERFHEETSIGVLTVGHLLDAKAIIDADHVRIDAVISDLFFDHGTTAPELELRDGLDILRYIQSVRPEIPKYVLSYWSQRRERLDKAQANNLSIEAWFDKVYIPRGGTLTSPWATVERNLISRRLRSDHSLADRLKAVGASPERQLDEETAAEAVRSLHPPVRTYLQEIDSRAFELAKPLEVICFRESGGFVRANAWRLGLFTEGHGESIEDALVDLGTKIIDQFEMLTALSDTDVEGYARTVRDRLRAYFQDKDAANEEQAG